MRTPKITAKRAMGLTLAGVLAVAGTVAVANVSSAASVQALKLSSATGGPAAGTVLTVTGKDFQSAAGTNKVGNIYFSTATCVANASPAAADVPSVTNVVSATKLTITTKALAATNGTKGTAYYLCVQDVAGANVVGSAKYTVYPAPYINASGYLSSATGPSLGGTTVTITGENFSTKTTATIGGKALTGVKVVLGSGTDATASNGDDTLTGMVPAGTAGSAVALAVTGLGGTTTQASAFTYVSAASVEPSSGSGAANNVITVNGIGFSSKTFANAAVAATTSSEVVLSPAGAIVTTTLPGSPVYCTSVQVVSDTELNCKLPALLTTAAGAYTVQVVDTTSATAVTSATGVSKGATYTAAAF